MVAIYRANRLPPARPAQPAAASERAESRFYANTPSNSKTRLFQLLERAVNAGELCPSNVDLCDVLGLRSPNRVPALMDRLVKDGLIEVERFNSSRVVKIVETGKSTRRPTNTTPPWRSR